MPNSSRIKLPSLDIISYNCSGLGNSDIYIYELLTSTQCDILCLQETWLPESCLTNFIPSDYSSCGVSGMDPTADIVHGRPHGGVAVLWKSSLNGVVSPVTTNHGRVSAVNLSLKPNVTLLVICVYLLCDTQKIHIDHEEFIDVLDHIEQLLYMRRL